MSTLLRALTSLPPSLGFICLVACAPVVSHQSSGTSIQIIFKQSGLQATGANAGGTALPPPVLSAEYCYALHALSPTIPALHYQGTWKPDTTCSTSPPSVGQVYGLVESTGQLKVDVPAGKDLRFDLIAIKKGDNDVFGPTDTCENYTVDPQFDGIEDGRPKVTLKLKHVSGNASQDLTESRLQASPDKFETRLVSTRSDVAIRPAL